MMDRRTFLSFLLILLISVFFFLTSEKIAEKRLGFFNTLILRINTGGWF